MLSTLLKICGIAVLSGTLSGASFSRSAALLALDGGQSTVSLNSAVSVVFVGIEGDYKATSTEELATWLLEEKKIVVVGESIRAMNNADRRVWALQSDDSKKLLKSLKSDLRKKGFAATALVATALSPLDDDPRALKAALFEVEDAEKKIWTLIGGGRLKPVWVFHESRIESKDIEAMFRKTKVRMSFFHKEFSFKSSVIKEAMSGQPTEAIDSVESLTETAAASMDCLKVTTRDGGLVMDLYMRDSSTMLLLKTDNGRHQFLCPNVQKSSIKYLQVPELDWQVTLEDTDMPFVK